MRLYNHDSSHAPNYEQKGWKLKEEKKYAEAIRAFNTAIRKNQKRYYALHGKGECLLELKKYSDAFDCFNEAISLDRKHPWAYHGVGRVYYAYQQYDTALIYFDKSLDIEQKGVIAWMWKGRTLIQLEKYEEAETALNTALRNALGTAKVKEHIPAIERDLAFVKARNMEKSREQEKNPARQIIIQGNTAPVNLGGILATDDAVINRAHLSRNEDETRPQPKPQPYFPEQPEEKPTGLFAKLFRKEKKICPACGHQIKGDGQFCNNCGRRLP